LLSKWGNNHAGYKPLEGEERLKTLKKEEELENRSRAEREWRLAIALVEL
jgi:hypothetical protein